MRPSYDQRRCIYGLYFYGYDSPARVRETHVYVMFPLMYVRYPTDTWAPYQ